MGNKPTVRVHVEKPERMISIPVREYKRLLFADINWLTICRDTAYNAMRNPDKRFSWVDNELVLKLTGVAYCERDEPDESKTAEVPQSEEAQNEDETLGDEIERLRKYIREQPMISENDKMMLGVFNPRGVFNKE